MQYIERTARELLPPNEYEKLRDVSAWFVNVRLSRFDWYNQHQIPQKYGKAELKQMIFAWTLGLIDQGEPFEQALSAATKELANFLRADSLHDHTEYNDDESTYFTLDEETLNINNTLTMGQWVHEQPMASDEDIKLANDLLEIMTPHQRELAEMLMAGTTMAEADRFAGRNQRAASMAMQSVRVKAVRHGLVDEGMAKKT